MRTNIDIDDDLLDRAATILGTGTKRATVEAALKDVVARQERLAFLDLPGRVRWEGDLERSREGRAP